VFYGEENLTSDVAICLRGIGETQQAITLGADSAHLRELDERLTTFLAHSA
jgi:hypothetical protein